MIAVSPKRLFLLMLVVLLPVQAAAQAQRTANDAINMSVSRIQRGGQKSGLQYFFTHARAFSYSF